MFKRRDDFLMEMDVEVNYDPVDALVKEHDLNPSDARATGLQSMIGHVQRAAKEALAGTRQKLKGSQVDTDGEWPRFSVGFQGDAPGAAAAYEGWCERVVNLAGTRRILTASLRGSEGTNFQYMDEELQKEYEAQFGALPNEAQEMIDQAMEP
jgi:hypothetical protein